MALITKDLAKHFGGLKALDGVSLTVESGIIHGIIGPNGAGKTTLFNLIAGYHRPTRGEIYYQGKRIDGLAPHLVAQHGIARTFQVVRPFTQMSVLENVLVAYGIRYYKGVVSLFRRFRLAKKPCMEILSFVGLQKHAHLPAGTLPIGLQRQLEIARALALNPSLLLLDEPASGLTEEEKQALKSLIRKVVEEGVTVVLVEHDMGFVMDLCERITVLDRGRILTEGPPNEVAHNEAVIEAYLGPRKVVKQAADPNREQDHVAG